MIFHVACMSCRKSCFECSAILILVEALLSCSPMAAMGLEPESEDELSSEVPSLSITRIADITLVSMRMSAASCTCFSTAHCSSPQRRVRWVRQQHHFTQDPGTVVPAAPT